MYYIIAFGLLYSLKGITNDNLILYFLPDFVLLVGIFRYAFINEVKLYLRKVEKSSNYMPYLGLAVLVGLSLLRSAHPWNSGIDFFTDLLTFSLFNMLIYSILSGPFRTRDYFDAIFTKGTLMIITVASAWVGLFLVISIVGSFETGARYQSQINNSEILELLGMSVKARPIPFTEGLRFSQISLLAAGTMIINFLAIKLFNLDSWKKNLLYASIGVCGLMILLSDSWGSLISLLLTAGVIYYYYRFKDTRFIRIGIWVVPLLPVVFMIFSTGIFGHSYSENITPQTEGGASTYSQRMIMWEKSTDHLLSPGIGHLLGEGQYGNISAGVNDAYYGIIPQTNKKHIESTRNTIFQVFQDMGLLGVVAFLFTIVMCFNNAVYLYDRGYVGGAIYAAFIVFMSFGCMFEPIIGIYNFPFMAISIMIMIGTIAYKNEFDRIASEDWN